MVYFRAGPRGCDVALTATWQRHAGPRGVYMYLYILYSLYNIGIQPSVVRKGIQPIKPSGLINLTGFTNIFRVGLSPTQSDVADGGTSIGRSAEDPRVDRVDADHRS